ncbi:MAG TPA: hypothetical protein VJP76_00405 [Candidatus Tumulicola sp.]|nr:hypothetical protein [Candidatus Tumulicola sp.]
MKRPMALLLLVTIATACAAHAPPRRAGTLSASARQTLVELISRYDADIATLRRVRSGAISGSLATQLTADEAAAAAELRAGAKQMAQQPRPRTRSAPAPRPAAVGPQTLAQFQSAAAVRVERAVALRAQQLREREADVAYDFERAHAQARLTLELRLHALHLAAADAARYRAQSNALTHEEERLVAAQRAKDGALLNAYGTQLRSEMASSVGSLAQDLRGRAAAAAALPTPAAGALPMALTRDERAGTAHAFEAARSDVGRRYAELRAVHDTAQASLTSEIAALERERDALVAALTRAQTRGATRPSPARESARGASASSSPRD